MSTDHYKTYTDTTKAMRHWCFTLNNYTDEEVDQFKLMGCRFIVFGFEIGEECGTPHLQGYVEFEGTKRLSAMKKINARAHWGIRYYTRQRARDYCKKGEQTKVEWDALHETGPNWGKNANIFTKGDWESGGSGTRNDLLAVKEAIQNGASLFDIMDSNIEVYSMHRNALKEYKTCLDKRNAREFRQVSVHVYWGLGGTGKTRKVFDEHPDAFRVQSWTESNKFMFDGYEGEDVILFDDFYGDLPPETFLRLFDGHPLTLNVKNGRTVAKYTKIFVTSNKPPEEWYPRSFTDTIQYTRRFTEIKEFK
jgi:hypothetical protein